MANSLLGNWKRPVRAFYFIVFCLLTSVWSSCSSTAFGRQDEPGASKLIDFGRDVAPILSVRCEKCHRGDQAKGGFVIEDREAVLGYLTPGSSMDSSLWTDYLVQPSKTVQEDSLVMPPDGPLPPNELAILKVWIEEGAEWPQDVKLSNSDAQSTPKTLLAPSETALWIRVYRAIGYLHPAVVHFPIVLFIVAGFCAFLSYFLGSRCQAMAFHALWVAMFTSMFAVVMGWSFAELQGYPAWNKPLGPNPTHNDMNLFNHRWLGTGLIAISCVVVFVSMMAARKKSSGLDHLWKVGAMVLAVLVSMVGHQGGELVYGEIFDKAMEQFNK